MSGEPKTGDDRAGDWLHEASVLAAVFGVLDKTVHNEPLSTGWIFGLSGIVVALYGAGRWFDRRRKAA